MTVMLNPFDAGGCGLAEMTQAINLLPKQVKAYFSAISDGVCPQYLGTSFLEHNHG